MSVVIHGAKDLDVSDIEQSSLSFHGAKPQSLEMKDVNADGKADLVMVFRRAEARLSVHAKYVQVKGWLKNSQVFTGTVEIAASAR